MFEWWLFIFIMNKKNIKIFTAFKFGAKHHACTISQYFNLTINTSQRQCWSIISASAVISVHIEFRSAESACCSYARPTISYGENDRCALPLHPGKFWSAVPTSTATSTARFVRVGLDNDVLAYLLWEADPWVIPGNTCDILIAVRLVMSLQCRSWIHRLPCSQHSSVCFHQHKCGVNPTIRSSLWRSPPKP